MPDDHDSGACQQQSKVVSDEAMQLPGVWTGTSC